MNLVPGADQKGAGFLDGQGKAALVLDLKGADVRRWPGKGARRPGDVRLWCNTRPAPVDGGGMAVNRIVQPIWIDEPRVGSRSAVAAAPVLVLVKRLKSSDAPATLEVIVIACQAMIDDYTDRLSAQFSLAEPLLPELSVMVAAVIHALVLPWT